MNNLRKDAKYVEESQNRGLDTKSNDSPKVSIELLDIDTAIIKYMTDVIQPYVIQDGNKVLVPIMYANPERWKTIRKDGVLRDKFDKLQIPLLAIKRTKLAKNKLNNPINKYLERDFSSVSWNKQNAYDRFAVQNGIKPSKQYVSVVYPDFYDITYECMIWTDFQQQMNSLLEQISFETENYWGDTTQYKFKTSVTEFDSDVTLPEKADRLVRTNFSMKVQAYLLPESYVDKYGKPASTNKIRFTTKKIVFEEKIVTD